MAEFKLQLVFRPHTDTAQALRVQIIDDPGKLGLSKQFIQLCRRRAIGKEIERAICLDLLRGPEQSAPRCERET